MGITVPSGMVVVAGPAVRLTCCWPKLIATTQRRNTLTRAAAFRVVFAVESFIRIIVVALSLCSVLDTNLNSGSPVLRGGSACGALEGKQMPATTGSRQLQIRVNP